MASLFPFRALRPQPSCAAAIAAVPYDVVTTAEARKLADGNPLSFLRVSRPDIELPAEVDPYSDAAYQRAAANFATLRDRAYLVETEPSVYVYRLGLGGHTQIGVAACFSVEEYEHDVIKKHERTRRDKEDDRTRHMLAVGAQTGPVLLTHRPSPAVEGVTARVTAGEPLVEFVAADGVGHTIWRADDADRDRLVSAFADIRSLYIADGHHRAASAARAHHEMRHRRIAGTDLGDGAGSGAMLGVAFPADQVRVLPYNRTVRDLAGFSSEEFLARVEDRFVMRAGPACPARRGEIAMYHAGTWRILTPRTAVDRGDRLATLDVSILQDGLIAPILGIADLRSDARIDFVGGARGTETLERLVESGQAAVAFSLYPVSVHDLMEVCDAGGIMPPKSTWFEPKLRDGLLVHAI